VQRRTQFVFTESLNYYTLTFSTNKADYASYKKLASAQVDPTTLDIAENYPPEMLKLPIYLTAGLRCPARAIFVNGPNVITQS
jgi:hypothetical protein